MEVERDWELPWKDRVWRIERSEREREKHKEERKSNRKIKMNCRRRKTRQGTA